MLIEVASYIPLFRPLEVLLDEYSIQSLLEKRKEFITQIPAAINVINSNINLTFFRILSVSRF